MILCINTKDPKVITVALKKDGQVISSVEDHNEYGSQVLLPLIIRVLQEHNLQFKDLTAIEVNEGPGSFTGLRVGASVAQALGFALNIPVNGGVNKPLELRYT